MKKAPLLLSVYRISMVTILTVFVFSGCNNKKASDIKVSELETACEHLDALEMCLDEIFEISGGEDLESLSKSKLEKIEKLALKIVKISDHAEKAELTDEETKDCSNFEEVVEKLEKMNDLGYSSFEY